jgi:hypothetical protein
MVFDPEADLLPPAVRAEFELMLQSQDMQNRMNKQPNPSKKTKSSSYLSLQALGEVLFGTVLDDNDDDRNTNDGLALSTRWDAGYDCEITTESFDIQSVDDNTDVMSLDPIDGRDHDESKSTSTVYESNMNKRSDLSTSLLVSKNLDATDSMSTTKKKIDSTLIPLAIEFLLPSAVYTSLNPEILTSDSTITIIEEAFRSLR